LPAVFRESPPATAPWRAPPDTEVAHDRKAQQHAEEERDRIEREEDEVVVSSDESFPASDPPSFNPGVTGANDVKKKKPGSRT